MTPARRGERNWTGRRGDKEKETSNPNVDEGKEETVGVRCVTKIKDSKRTYRE